MNYEDERKAIETRFETGWADYTSVRYENVRFEEPKDTPWVALTIVNGSGRQTTLLEGETHRHHGMIVVQIFTQKDGGTAAARVLADRAESIFRSSKFSSGGSGTIVCLSSEIMNVGIREGWFQINVKIPFKRYSKSP